MKIEKALIYVSDTTNLHKLGPFLQHHGVDIVSWGQTRKYLKQHQVKARDLTHEEVERFETDLTSDFQLIVINLKDIEQEISKPDSTVELVMQNIELDKHMILRTAASRYNDTILLTDPSFYETYMATATISNSLDLDTKTRCMLAQKAFAKTSKYDEIVSQYLYINACKI